MLQAVCDETFSPNANGVGADVGNTLIAPTPLALGLNVKMPLSRPCKSIVVFRSAKERPFAERKTTDQQTALGLVVLVP